jgi:dihydrofolate reductase
MSNLSLIVAMTRDRVIGRNNQLPWHLSEDLKRFKQITMGHPIVMGRKTYESIGKPLPGRDNVVLTRDPQYHADGIFVVHSLEEAMARHPDSEQFIIGGADIFRLAYPQIQKVYLTFIEQPFPGDTYFPEFNLEKDFQVIEDSGLLHSEKNAIPYRFVTAVRTQSSNQGFI